MIVNVMHNYILCKRCEMYGEGTMRMTRNIAMFHFILVLEGLDNLTV
jgi:hypothetical protein